MAMLRIKFKTFFLLACAAGLVACEDEAQVTPTYVVTEKPFSVEMQGFGEIEAAEAVKIVSPGSQPMTIAWLADENSLVKKEMEDTKFLSY